METNKDTFKATGYKADYPRGYYQIEVSKDGDNARYRLITHIWSTNKDVVAAQGRWQCIQYNKRNGSPYIKCRNRRLYIDEFIRYDINYRSNNI